MKKIIIGILVLFSLSANGQIVNKFRDSSWFKSGVRFDSTLVFSKGAGNGKVWTSNANGTGSWQTFTASGVTQGALDDSILRIDGTINGLRFVDTLYRNSDSIVFKIKGIRYAIKDSSGISLQTLNDSLARIDSTINAIPPQTLAISGDTLSISGGNSVLLPVYVNTDTATVTEYTVLNSQNAPPVSPNIGDTYLVGNSPTGAWVGHAKDIAEWNGISWDFTDGVQGDYLYNTTTALTYIFRSGNWVQTTGIPALHKGNTISSGLTLGTKNAKDFSFISNNQLRGSFGSSGSFKVNNLGGSGNVLVKADNLGVQSKTYIGDGLTLRNDSLIGSSADIDNYIPLTGTAVGEPVTGDIELNGTQYDIGLNQTYNDNVNKINFRQDEGLFLTAINTINGNQSFVNIAENSIYNQGGTTSFIIGDFGVQIGALSSTKGLTSNTDYSSNIDSLDYTQKKYVDNRIADTASALRALIPSVSGYATQTALNDTALTLRQIRKVDTMYRRLDSIIFPINGLRHAIKDSVNPVPTFSYGRNATLDSTIAIFNGTRYAAKDSSGANQTPWTSNINANGNTLFGNSTSGGSLTLSSTSNPTKGQINLQGTVAWTADLFSPPSYSISRNSGYFQMNAGTNGFNINNSGNTANLFHVKDDGATCVGGLSPAASAKLEVRSTTSGFLPPKMTTTQRDAISSPAAGLMIYDTTVNKVSVYNGTSWKYLMYE